MAWVRASGGGTTPSIPEAIFLQGGGTASFSISIPTIATYLLTYNIQVDSNIPTITNCSYLGAKDVESYNFSNVPSGSKPNSSSTIRIFKVNSSGAQTVTQQGGTIITYITTNDF